MHLTAHALRTWADEQQIPDLTLAELDYRLTRALAAILNDSFLRERLRLKGGTTLSKLFFPAVNRLSVDLGFNAVGPKAQVFAERAQIASQVMALLTAQDAAYEFTHDYRRYEQSTIQAYYRILVFCNEATLYDAVERSRFAYHQWIREVEQATAVSSAANTKRSIRRGSRSWTGLRRRTLCSE